MEDRELKKLLIETCPVRPGQENRAWTAFRECLNGQSPAGRASSGTGGLPLSGWRKWGAGLVLLALIAIAGDYVYVSTRPIPLATADSQSPGIYATAFYSDSAQAQVVWLNGMAPATDKPTYLDPTTVVSPDSSASAGDPNRL